MPPMYIPAGMNKTCFQFVAVDDRIAEYTEMFNITVTAVNSLDGVDVGTTTVSIIDNDGECVCVCIHFTSIPPK